MASVENSNWDLDALIENFPVADSDFVVGDNVFLWTPQGINPFTSLSGDNSASLAAYANQEESLSKKRGRSKSSDPPTAKAFKEKVRRDKLNKNFMELASILDSGNPKADKAAILSDAVKALNQLRAEAQKFKDSNENLQERINELKNEKDELRFEKQRLKQEKENLEQQIKLVSSQPIFMPPTIMPTAFAAPQGQPAPSKMMMMPMMGYHGYPMWSLMPPSSTYTSQDGDSHSPAA